MPSSTCWPSATSNSMSSASETATETRGMRMVKSAMHIRTGGLEGALHGRGDSRRRRVELGLQRSGRRRRDESRRNAFDGCRELAEAFSLQRCHYLGSWACELDRIVH